MLLSADPGNVDCECDLVPPDLSPALRRAVVVVVTNFHAFGLRETREGKGASKTTKQVLGPTVTVKAFTETPAQMVSRVCWEFGPRGRLGVPEPRPPGRNDRARPRFARAMQRQAGITPGHGKPRNCCLDAGRRAALDAVTRRALPGRAGSCAPRSGLQLVPKPPLL